MAASSLLLGQSDVQDTQMVQRVIVLFYGNLTQTEVECIFRAFQGPLNLHCRRIRAATGRTPYTLIKCTEISGPPESTLHLLSVSVQVH